MSAFSFCLSLSSLIKFGFPNRKSGGLPLLPSFSAYSPCKVGLECDVDAAAYPVVMKVSSTKMKKISLSRFFEMMMAY